MADVFLDLDGTLIDPKPGITAAVASALSRLGLSPPHADDLEWVIGPPLIDSFRMLGAPDPAAALALYRVDYAAGGLLNCAVYPGIPDALAALKAAGHRLFLATAKPWTYATRITAHFGLDRWLDGQYGPKLDGTRNDKRALLAFARADLRSSGGGIMIGDRSIDIAAAHSNGMPAIGVDWGYGTPAELAEAEVVCSDVARLPGLVADILARAG